MKVKRGYISTATARVMLCSAIQGALMLLKFEFKNEGILPRPDFKNGNFKTKAKYIGATRVNTPFFDFELGMFSNRFKNALRPVFRFPILRTPYGGYANLKTALSVNRTIVKSVDVATRPGVTI